MQVTTISFFRFRGPTARIWAFVSMGLARAPLSKLPGIHFYKLMGTGNGQGFDLTPNLSVYAILATWSSLDAARGQIGSSEIYQKYRQRSVENWTVYLQPTLARGSWDEQTPFQPDSDSSDDVDSGGWIGVLTRARVKTWSLLRFWWTVPPISRRTAAVPDLFFKLGMGELPIVQLMTFSVWEGVEPMKQFAYRAGPHREAVKLARTHQWFKEELFARFRVLGSSGTWNGRDPLEKAPQEEAAHG